jgi:quinol monooxygenase YgiN
MIAVKAILQAQPGKEQELQQVLRDFIPSVEAEEGAVTYTLHRAQENPGRFFFYEKYRDQQACNDHMATPYIQEFLKQIEKFLLDAPEVELFEEIGGFTRNSS